MRRSIGLAPALPRRAAGPLARYRPPELEEAAAAFIAHLTSPGDLVLDLFCRSAAFLRPAIRQGRRAIGVGVNPIGLLLAGLEAQPPDRPHTLTAAFTYLGDQPKGERPLRHHLTDLYRARCPTCQADGVAEWFVWDREAGYPYLKAVRCPRCDGVQEGPTDEEDIAAARRFDPKGPPYHYALGRVVPPEHPARERAAELVGLYTPRNLAALMDVTLRLEGLKIGRAARAGLRGVLLEALDRGSSLDPYGEARPRPRTLRPPARFLERNVWFLLERGLDQTTTWLLDRHPLPHAPDLTHLLTESRPAYFLHPSPARRVDRLLPPESVALVLADPPRPDGVFWALCALWSGWLWGDVPLARAMRPFLRRRRFDWEWHRRALQAALAAAATRLRPEGYLVLLFADPPPPLVSSACMAAAGAGYDLVGWGADPDAGCHLVWRWVGRRAAPIDAETLVADLTAAAERRIRSCLQERAEPTSPLLLHTAVYAGLAEEGRLARALATVDHAPADAALLPPLALTAQAVETGLTRVPLRKDEDTGWVWLPTGRGKAAEPLADRVETRTLEVLLSRPEWTTADLLGEIFAPFTGPLTPDLALVRACVESYARFADGVWRVREEDQPRRRAEEMRALEEALKALGRRLGFQVGTGKGWRVRWREGRRDVYLFALSPTAALGPYLLRGRRIPGSAHPCLVFPGGRAELLAHKLRRDPRLARAAAEQGWHFIKFRHLRRLIAEGLDRRLFETMLGLDPIVEQEGVQIPLVLGGEE